MKNLLISIPIIIIISSCSNHYYLSDINSFEDADISFKIKVDSLKLKVNIKNNSVVSLKLSTPLNYFLVYYKIFDKSDNEYLAPKIRADLNLMKEVINLKSKKEFTGYVNLGINSFVGKSDIKNWHKIIAYYSYYGYKNGSNIITDTLINNQ